MRFLFELPMHGSFLESVRICVVLQKPGDLPFTRMVRQRREVPPRQARRVAAVIIGAAGLAAYAGSFSGPFVLDDPSSITANPTIRQLWPLGDVLATPQANVTAQGRPLLNLSLAVNYALSRHDVWSYHLLNLMIHVLAGLTLFGLVRRTLARRGQAPTAAAKCAWPTNPGAAVGDDAGSEREVTATALGFAVALLWTLHPLQTESVTYVVQRAESLMGLFYLLTLYCFVRYTEAGPPARLIGWNGRAMLACLGGMATKEVMVTAPVMVLLYDRAFVAGSWRAAWRQRRGFYAGLAATWLLLGACMLSGGGNRGGAVGFGTGVAWWDYGLTQFEAVGRYLLLAFWPDPLVFEYGAFTAGNVWDVLPWAAIVGPLLGATLWALWCRPAVGFLGAWFFGILAPTSLVPGTSQMIVEHRAYLSLAAILVLAVCGGHAVALRRKPGDPSSVAGPGAHAAGTPGPGAAGLSRRMRAFLSLTLLVALAFGILTARRNAVYRTALGLWEETVAQRPHNPLAHHLLAEELVSAGRDDEALGHYRQAVRVDPGFALAHERLGVVLMRLGKGEEAEAHLKESLRLRPDFADAHNNLGVLLAGTGRGGEARGHLERALALQPDFADAHYNLANLLALQGSGPEAVASFRTALRLRPDFPAAQYNLANALANLGRHADAIAHYAAALRLKPDQAAAEFNLGNALAILGRREEAIEHYRKALRWKPDFAAAEMNLGCVCFELGRLTEAAAHLQNAVRLDPKLDGAQEMLGRVRDAERR